MTACRAGSPSVVGGNIVTSCTPTPLPPGAGSSCAVRAELDRVRGLHRDRGLSVASAEADRDRLVEPVDEGDRRAGRAARERDEVGAGRPATASICARGRWRRARAPGRRRAGVGRALYEDACSAAPVEPVGHVVVVGEQVGRARRPCASGVRVASTFGRPSLGAAARSGGRPASPAYVGVVRRRCTGIRSSHGRSSPPKKSASRSAARGATSAGSRDDERRSPSAVRASSAASARIRWRIARGRRAAWARGRRRRPARRSVSELRPVGSRATAPGPANAAVGQQHDGSRGRRREAARGRRAAAGRHGGAAVEAPGQHPPRRPGRRTCGEAGPSADQRGDVGVAVGHVEQVSRRRRGQELLQHRRVARALPRPRVVGGAGLGTRRGTVALLGSPSSGLGVVRRARRSCRRRRRRRLVRRAEQAAGCRAPKSLRASSTAGSTTQVTGRAGGRAEVGEPGQPAVGPVRSTHRQGR